MPPCLSYKVGENCAIFLTPATSSLGVGVGVYRYKQVTSTNRDSWGELNAAKAQGHQLNKRQECLVLRVQ